jgi:hypothetical protein
MAELFVKQGKEYADARPSYPPQLFQFIASKTPSHNRVWDVATGSGQAAKSVRPHIYFIPSLYHHHHRVLLIPFSFSFNYCNNFNYVLLISCYFIYV